MKKISKYLFVAFILIGMTYSCETIDLDLQDSPNNLAADQADPNLLLNSVQLAYASNMNFINDLGGRVTRIEYLNGRDYANTFPGSTFDNFWQRVYSSADFQIGVNTVKVGIFPNVANIIQINSDSEIDYSFHIALGQTLKAHMLLLSVDYLGKAAFSEAGNVDEFPAPTLDEGTAIYASALGLLSEAEALFAAEPSTQGAQDFFYGGDSEKWIKLINTIRLKVSITTGDISGFNSIIAANNYISSSADDFQFQYGSRELQPDTRHPIFQTDYTPSGARNYRSNWLMNNMLNRNDPRMRYYFYRQQDVTPGVDGTPPREEVLACSLVTPPTHYAGFIYCGVSNGYWGRSHGNDEGGPPDNFLRTTGGVYPHGGRFDDNSFGEVGLGQGGGGAGIEPIMLASYVDFWQAEAAMLSSPAAGRPFMLSGMAKSVTKAESFGILDVGADTSLAPSSADIDAFLANVAANFDALDDEGKWNLMAEQYWTAMYGGGTEAYNFYRRTGFPTTLAPNWEENPGSFPRTFLYAQTEVITNPNLTQKQTLGEQVFWDTNPAGPAFPSSN